MKRRTKHLIVIVLMLLNNLLFTTIMGVGVIVSFQIHRWWEVGVDLLSFCLCMFVNLWLVAVLAVAIKGNLKVSYTPPED